MINISGHGASITVDLTTLSQDSTNTLDFGIRHHILQSLSPHENIETNGTSLQGIGWLKGQFKFVMQWTFQHNSCALRRTSSGKKYINIIISPQES